MNTGWKSTGRKLSLNESRGMDEFIFTLGDVVLAEWEDKLYYAKIQKIDRVCGKCTLIFDDDSVEECSFAKIHSGSSIVLTLSFFSFISGKHDQRKSITASDHGGSEIGFSCLRFHLGSN